LHQTGIRGTTTAPSTLATEAIPRLSTQAFPPAAKYKYSSSTPSVLRVPPSYIRSIHSLLCFRPVLAEMSALANATQHQQPAEMTSSSPADSVLSAVALLLGNLSGWSLVVTTLLAIIIYDQGTKTLNRTRRLTRDSQIPNQQ